MVSRWAITIYANLSGAFESNRAGRRLYTGLVARVFQVPLNENELKLILAALRQVKHTFELAHRQAGVDSTVAEYERVEGLYEELHDRLQQLIDPPPGSSPLRRVK